MSPGLSSLLSVAPLPSLRKCTSVTATVAAYPWHSLHAVRAGQLKKCLTTTWLASVLLRRELRGSRGPWHGESTLLVSLVGWIQLRFEGSHARSGGGGITVVI